MNSLPFFIAWRYIKGRGNALLSLNARLSFIGIFVGTSLLVVVLSIFNGFQTQLKNSIFKFDPHLTLTRETGSGPEKITDWQAYKKRLQERYGDKAISIEGNITSPAIVRRKNTIEHIFLRGLEFTPAGKKWQIPSFFPQLVEPEGLQEIPQGNYCLIGREMAVNLGLYVGDTLEIVVPRGQFSLQLGVTPSIKAYKVAGFFKTGHYQYDSRVIVLPLQEAQNLFSVGEAVQQINIRLKSIEELREGKAIALKTWPFSIRTIEDEQRNFFHALQLEKTIMTIIVFLFVIAAIVGIVVATYNIVNSHRKDIGILKAIGVRNQTIVAVFTLSGFGMGFLGTLSGIMTGIFLALNLENIVSFIEKVINAVGRYYTEQWRDGIWFHVSLIPRDVYYFDSLPIHIDPHMLHMVGSVAIVLSGIAALLPALAASRLEPVRIIRGAE